MTLYCLRRTQKLPIAPDVAWAFFQNPANLAAITPPGLGFSITCTPPRELHPGLILTYTIRVLGIRIPWVTEITQACPPELFVDEQRFGPYKFWHHQHHIRPIEGGVEVEDVVHYMLPGWILGRLLHGLMIRRQLREIFDYRARMLEDYFGVMPGGTSL